MTVSGTETRWSSLEVRLICPCVPPPARRQWRQPITRKSVKLLGLFRSRSNLSAVSHVESAILGQVIAADGCA